MARGRDFEDGVEGFQGGLESATFTQEPHAGTPLPLDDLSASTKSVVWVGGWRREGGRDEWGCSFNIVHFGRES